MTSSLGFSDQKPRVGVGVLVVRDGKILLGQRKGAHGVGMWAPPGGHLEFGESVEECAKRELLEETGIEALAMRLGPWAENVMEDKHYITVFTMIDQFVGEPQLLEPHKCEGWHWFDWNQLPEPLFPPIQSLMEGQSIDLLLKKIVGFCKERDWEQFHSPKNLVMDLAAETGELVEPFRWLTEEQSYTLDEKTLQAVKEEIGDVFKIILYLSHKLGIDPIQATYEKLEKMGKKYPAEACRGKAAKYTAYEGALKIK